MPIPLEFKTEYAPGTDKAVDWVLLAPKGQGHERTQTWHRVSKLRPPDGLTKKEREAPSWLAMCARWEQSIGPAYEAWRKGEEIPAEGTPLAAWSGITVEQAEILKKMHVRTVEDVRELDDRTLSELRWPNARRMPELAAQFLASRDVVKRDNDAADMRERLAAMEELIAAQAQEIERAKSEKPKPKRGRPRKEPEPPHNEIPAGDEVGA